MHLCLFASDSCKYIYTVLSIAILKNGNLYIDIVSQDVVPRIVYRNVHYTNERADFKCVVRRTEGVIWFLNDTSLPRDPVEPFMARVESIWYSHNFTSILTMDASPETDHTRIVCQVFNGFEGYNLPTIILSVQGKQQMPVF